MNPKIWLSPPHMSGYEMNYIQEAFDTNWISPMGPNIDSFEDELAAKLNVSSVAAVSSGTAALHLALNILGVGKDDIVLCSSFTFSASVNPVVYVGGMPYLIDSEQDTWNMDPELLEKAIEDLDEQGLRPKALILVHLYGMPANLVRIMEIAGKYQIPVIEDAAEALGSKYDGKALGTFGTMGILSFNGNKIITTSGGGALISNNPDYIEKAKFLATQARDDAPHYQHSEIGYNYRMSNVVAGIGRGQLIVLDDRVKKRREINRLYKNELKDIEGVSFQQEPEGYFSNFWLTTILINPQKTGGVTREDIRFALEQENIEARPLWKPMHLQPVYHDAPRLVNQTSELMFNNGLCLPSGSNLSRDDQYRVIDIVLKKLGRKGTGRVGATREQQQHPVEVPFSPPRIDGKILESVHKTLRSGWITTGPKTREFEQKLATYCGNSYTVCVNSATAGLEMMLRWFGVGPGDEVIIPAYTYCATGNVVIRCGAKPVFADINEQDMLLDTGKVRALITPKTKVIIPVDFGGLPCDYNEIYEIINDPEIRSLFHPETTEQEKLGRILILADAAHSLGASYKGKKTGVLSDITVFSFHAVKNLTTAEGGAIALNLPEPFDNEEIYSFLRTYSLHGQTKDALLKTVEGSWQYDVLVPGMKANMPDVLAAMGSVEMDRYNQDTLPKLEWVFRMYNELLGKYEWAILPVSKTRDKKSAYHIYALRINGISDKDRDRVIHLCQGSGVLLNVHFQPLPQFSAYRKLGYNMESLPVSAKVASQEISLPVFYDISEPQIKRAVEVLSQSLTNIGIKI